MTGRVRPSSTPAADRMSATQLVVMRKATKYPRNVDRPQTRGDCSGGARPCPFVSCRHHLALDVNKTGSVKTNFPDREVWELEETCSLDVADRGGLTLEVVGGLMNITRERVRQLEAIAAQTIADRYDEALLDHAEDRLGRRPKTGPRARKVRSDAY